MEGPNTSNPVIILQRSATRFGEFVFIRSSSYPIYFSRACSCGFHSISLTIYSSNFNVVQQMFYTNSSQSLSLIHNMDPCRVVKINNACPCDGVFCDVLFIDTRLLSCLEYFDFDRGVFHRISEKKWSLSRCYICRLMPCETDGNLEWTGVISTMCPSGKVRLSYMTSIEKKF